MYDRKKITLFILLIATVILGGVSLYLATQINQSQAPDDSLAGNQVCVPTVSNPSEFVISTCSQQDETTCGNFSYCQLITTNTSCPIPGSSSSVVAGDKSCVSGSEYTCFVGGSNATLTGCCQSYTMVNGACQPPSTCSAPGGQTVAEGSSICNSGTSNRRYSCINAGGSAIALNECCSPYTWNGTSCVTATPDPGQTGTDNCTQSGQTITHGATSCIDGTNYSCSNGTVTPGGSCGTTTGGTTTGTPTCSNEAPIKAQLLTPKNNSVVNTASVTLSWNKNGSFGVNCAGNTNEYKVRVLVVGLNESCPASSGLSNVATIQAGTGDGDGNFSHNITVQDDTKVCWTIRKRNGALATDTGIRNFVVNLADTNPAPGDDTDDGSSSVIVDTGNVAGADSSLPATAIISDELDSLILGMILVIIGLTLYKFDFGRKREEA